MKKLIGIIAGLKMGVSSILMGSTLEIIRGGAYLVRTDCLSKSEFQLIREGAFQYNPVLGRFENDEFVLLAGPVDSSIKKDFSLKSVCLPTTEIKFIVNLSSGAATSVGSSFAQTLRIFDSKGALQNLIFTYTRLSAGADSDNRIQYSTEITVNGGTVKRTDAVGTVLDSSGAPMIITFNQRGQLNLVDYGQPTESNTPPKLYIEWNDLDTADPLAIELKWCKGKGAMSIIWSGSPDPLAMGMGIITADDGLSLFMSWQDGGYEISRLLSSKEPLQFLLIEKAIGWKPKEKLISSQNVGGKSAAVDFSPVVTSGTTEVHIHQVQ